jgi:hypothetical protein
MGFQTWSESNKYWGDRQPAIQLKWDEAQAIAQRAADAIDEAAATGKDVLAAINSMPKADKKRFINLVVTFKNNIKVYEGRKSIKDDLEITVEDVQMVIKEVLDIDIIAENIHV